MVNDSSPQYPPKTLKIAVVDNPTVLWCPSPRHFLHRFRDIAGFLLYDPTLFDPNFGNVPVGPDSPMLGSARDKSLSDRISREIICEVWKSYLNVTDGQLAVAIGITALCVASRGVNTNKNQKLND